MTRRGTSRRGIRFALILTTALWVCSAREVRAGSPYVVGHVFAGVGSGQVKEFTPTGSLVQTLNDTTGSTYTTGMCFDTAGNLLVTNFSGSTVSKFDNSGNLINASFLTGLTQPESCVFDAAGNIYVGGPSQPIRKFLSTGGAPVTSYSVTAGSDWIDLMPDQCTMLYDNETGSIGRYNVCTSTQLTNFATGLPGPHYALRILPGGGVIVAAGGACQLLDSGGNLVSSYTATGESVFFALNRDPDGTTFWTGGLNTGLIYRFNFSPVAPPFTTFTSAPITLLAGLTVFGELIVSQPTPTPTGPPQSTPTPTRTTTPQGGGATVVVPTLSFPMLALMCLALMGAAFFLMRR